MRYQAGVILGLLTLVWALSLPGDVIASQPSVAAAEDDLVFIHHSCGSNWLSSGLHSALVAKEYIDQRNDIGYGTAMAPDPGRPASLGSKPGDNTNMNHWILWFNDYLSGVKRHQAATGVNRVIMFKSCYPISDVSSDGRELGDPFSGEQTLANYRAVYRHPGGPGNVFSRGGLVYRPLEDIFAMNPDTLFIPVTAPPLVNRQTNDSAARRARLFNNWLKNEWMAGYNAAHPGLNNVAVFDWFDVLANPDGYISYPNRLRSEYGGETNDSHPNASANAYSVQLFASAPDSFIDRAWAAFRSGRSTSSSPVSTTLAPVRFSFQLGFRTLADQIPSLVGDPLEDEHWGVNGDSLQRTARGLMVWRKADNWTAFTDGTRTWVNGPFGVQTRPNEERFEWEAR